MVILAKQTRMPHGVRDTRSSVAKSDDATLTETELMKYGAITQSGTGKKITIPAASSTYKGVGLIVASIHASSATNEVYVAAGFNGGSTDYDTINLPALGSILLYCDGTYWFCVGGSPAAS